MSNAQPLLIHASVSIIGRLHLPMFCVCIVIKTLIIEEPVSIYQTSAVKRKRESRSPFVIVASNISTSLDRILHKSWLSLKLASRNKETTSRTTIFKCICKSSPSICSGLTIETKLKSLFTSIFSICLDYEMMSSHWLNSGSTRSESKRIEQH